jgi:hypothetical protein
MTVTPREVIRAFKAICAQQDGFLAPGSTYRQLRRMIKIKRLERLVLNEINDWSYGCQKVLKHQRLEGLKTLTLLEDKQTLPREILRVLEEVADYITARQTLPSKR